MIRLDHVWFHYADSAQPALRDISADIDEAEMVLLAGRTGSGKSTLLGALNGVVPHFTGGTLAGDVSVDERSTRDHPPRDLADVIGYVGQDPVAGFVTDTVEEELADGMEQLGLAPQVMRRRVEEVLDLLGVAELRHRPLHAFRRPAATNRHRLGADNPSALSGARRTHFGAAPHGGRRRPGDARAAGRRSGDHGDSGRTSHGTSHSVRRPDAVSR